MRDQARIPDCVSDLMKGVQVPPQFYNTTPTLEDVQNFHARRLTLDLETNRFTQQIICCGIAKEPHHVLCVPFKGAYIPELKRILLEAEEIIGQNLIAFDLPILCEALGIVF